MDPFQWLGTVSGRDLTPYQVVGLEPFESDPAKIAWAIAEARHRLEPLRDGVHAQRCRRLLELVSRAEMILTDPTHKRTCDEHLRMKLDAASVQVVGAMRAAAKSSPSTLRRSARWRPSPRAKQVAKLVIAILLLAATVFLLRDLIWSPPRFPTHRSPTPESEVRQQQRWAAIPRVER